MSTQINVAVDSGGLLERSRQQQAANRQAFVESEQRADAEQTGTEQRQERLAAEGRNADGVLLLGRQPELNRYRQEPAANRRTKDYKLVYANFTSDFSSITPCTLAGCTTHTYRSPMPDPNSSLIEGPTGGGYTDYQFNPLTQQDWPLSNESIRNYSCSDGIDPYYVGWGPHPIDTNYSWRQNVNKIRAGLFGSLILPLSSSTYIVCQVSYGWSYWVKLYTTYTNQISRSLVDCGKRIPNNCNLEIILYYRREERSVTWTHEEDHGSYSYPTQYVSVLVGKQSQRVINTPFAIQQALLEYATAANRQSLEFSSSNDLVGNNYYSLETRNCEGGYYYFEVPTTVTPVYRDTPQYNVVTGPAPSLTSLHFTYKGIANAKTPAVYALLRSSVSDARSVTFDTYEDWYANSPYRYPGINSVDPSKLSSDPSKDGIPVWNWNATGYCREQLLALGFSPSDLSL